MVGRGEKDGIRNGDKIERREKCIDASKKERRRKESRIGSLFFFSGTFLFFLFSLFFNPNRSFPSCLIACSKSASR